LSSLKSAWSKWLFWTQFSLVILSSSKQMVRQWLSWHSPCQHPTLSFVYPRQAVWTDSHSSI
jgi:hypothetical protein